VFGCEICQKEIILVSLSTLYLELYLVVYTTHPSNHSHPCPLKYHLIFLSYGPGLIRISPMDSDNQ